MLRLNAFDVREPETVREALFLLRNERGAAVIAGGTDFVPKLKRGQFAPPVVVSLSRIRDLDVVRTDGNGVHIGAMTTLSTLERSSALEPFRALIEAARSVATPTVRHWATVGGNLLQDTRCRFYDRSGFWRDAIGGCLKIGAEACRIAPGGARCYATFCSDMAPALIVHDAVAVLQGRRRRRMPLEDLYVEDGLNHVRLNHEILVEVIIPTNTYRSCYKKLRIRSGFDFPEVGLAVAVKKAGKRLAVNVAVTGVMSSVYVIKQIVRPDEIGRLIERINRDVKPMDTMFFAPSYRKKVMDVFLVRAFGELLAD